MRTPILAMLFLGIIQGTAIAGEVAMSNQMATPRTQAKCQILGAQKYVLDTYGINLALADGVRPRDLYEIRRGDKKIAVAVVVYVCERYSLVTLKGTQATQLRPGDRAVYTRHVDVPKARIRINPQAETIVVKERDFLSSRQLPSGSFTSSVSFGSSIATGFSLPGLSIPTLSFSGSIGFPAPQFSTPAGFSAPASFSSTAGFSPHTGFSPNMGFSPPSFSR